MTQIPHGRNAGHARATLQSVQRTLQRRAQFGVIRFCAPGSDRGLGAFQQLGRLFRKDARDLGVKLRHGIGRRLRLLSGMRGVRRFGDTPIEAGVRMGDAL